MILPYSACLPLRSTFTTTVLSPLSETISPVSTRFGMSKSLLGSRVARASGLQRLDTGDVATDFANPTRLLELVGRSLKTEVERLALQIAQFLGELILALRLQIVDPCHITRLPDARCRR